MSHRPYYGQASYVNPERLNQYAPQVSYRTGSYDAAYDVQPPAGYSYQRSTSLGPPARRYHYRSTITSEELAATEKARERELQQYLQYQVEEKKRLEEERKRQEELEDRLLEESYRRQQEKFDRQSQEEAERRRIKEQQIKQRQEAHRARIETLYAQRQASLDKLLNAVSNPVARKPEEEEKAKKRVQIVEPAKAKEKEQQDKGFRFEGSKPPSLYQDMISLKADFGPRKPNRRDYLDSLNLDRISPSEVQEIDGKRRRIPPKRDDDFGLNLDAASKAVYLKNRESNPLFNDDRTRLKRIPERRRQRAAVPEEDQKQRILLAPAIKVEDFSRHSAPKQRQAMKSSAAQTSPSRTIDSEIQTEEQQPEYWDDDVLDEEYYVNIEDDDDVHGETSDKIDDQKNRSFDWRIKMADGDAMDPEDDESRENLKREFIGQNPDMRSQFAALRSDLWHESLDIPSSKEVLPPIRRKRSTSAPASGRRAEERPKVDQDAQTEADLLGTGDAQEEHPAAQDPTRASDRRPRKQELWMDLDTTDRTLLRNFVTSREDVMEREVVTST